MKKSCLVCLIIFMALAVNCSDDKPTTPSEPAETLLTSVTIGAGGGIITTDDFTLTVPAGALTSEVELSLYDAGVDHTFGDDAISPVYRIKGLPEEFSQPLQISLKYEGTLSEESFIAQGVEDYLVGEEEPSIFYDFHAATDSNGFLWAEVPARSNELSSGKLLNAAMGKNLAGLRKDDFLAIANFKSHVSTAHFKIVYPLYLIDYIDDIGKYLEAGYDTVVSLGLGWANAPWNWPITATVKKFETKYAAKYLGLTFPKSTGTRPRITYNESKMSLSSLPRFRFVSGWALVTSALGMYDPESSSFSAPQNAWLHSAVGRWSSELFTDNPQTFVPITFPSRELTIFKGLRAGAGNYFTAAWSHGDGLAPVVKFLMEDSRFGKDGLLRCYQYIKNGDDATTALIDALYDTEDDWFPDFFQQYLQGNIYNVGGDVFTKSSNISGTMNTDTDTLKEFPHTYPDLSAKLYRIDLSANKLSTGASISFEVDASQTNEDYVTTQIYRIKDNRLEFITEGLNVTVGGVKESAEEGYDLIACVVNASNEAPYTGSSPLELTVRVLEPPPFTWCKIKVGLTVVFLDDNDTTHYEADPLEPGWTATGQMTENSFTWDIDSTFHGNTNTHGTMSVTIDPGSMSVVSFSANATSTDAYGVSRWSIAGTALPQAHYIPNSELTCQENGTTTCSRITDFKWSYESSSYNTNIVSYRCKANAYVSVSLKR